jgi:Big-like domain-containing protein
MGRLPKPKTLVKPYLAPATLLWLSIFSACGAGSFGPGLGGSPPPVELVSIAVTPPDPVLLLGTVQQFTATGTFSDGSVKDITGSVIWGSSSGTVASITGGGLATALALGSVTVSATSGSAIGNTTADIQAATLSSLAIRPASGKIAQLTSQQFQAIGTYTDGSTHNVTGQVSWTSSNSIVSTISRWGRANGLAPGTTTIAASLQSISASTTLEVTNATIVRVSVSPSGRTIPPGTSLSFAATGLFSDNTTQVITRDSTWTSDNGAVATLKGGNTATAVGPGTANISATFNGVAGFSPLHVSSATLSSISVTPASVVLAPGTSESCVATGTFSDGSTEVITALVTWTSSASEVASVSTRGKVSAISGGSATITSQLGPISGDSSVVVDSSQLTSIQILPPAASIRQQTDVVFQAIGTFADGNTQDLTTSVLWTSSPASVATISIGRATGVAPGTALIVALFDGQVGTASLTVIGATSTPSASTAGTNLVQRGFEQSTALADFADTTNQDVTPWATWTYSSAPGTAVVKVH